MMKQIMLFMLAFVGIMMASCTTDTYQTDTNPVSKNGVLFKFTLPGSENPVTKSVEAESGENMVHDLTVLFFEPTTNGTGRLVTSYIAPLAQLPSGNQSQFVLEIEAMTGTGLVKTNAYSILTFANMMSNMFNTEAELNSFLAKLVGKTENEVMNYAIMHIKGVDDNDISMSGGIDITNLPMSAQSTKKANVDIVDVQLIRTVSRFDVTNATQTHKIVSVSVWNAFTEATVWEKGYMDYSQARTRRFYGRNFPAGQEYMRGGIYAFQNVSTSPEQNDTKTTCLIIGIQENGGGNTTYHRVNINPSESGQYLKRNNVYQVTIQKVTGAGESSEVNAYVRGKVLLDISINSWDRDEDGLIIRDGDNLLAIPTRKARFLPEAEQRQYFVYTVGEGTLELIELDMPTGMDAWLGGSTGKDLFVSVDAFTFDQRKGSIELRFAGMKGVIEIIQSGATEKSLKLSHTDIGLFPAGARANMLGADPILITSSNRWTAEIFGDYFSFKMDDINIKTLTGDSGDFINEIYSNAVNGNVGSRTNFVLITLDEDPDNYRNVLVLTQSGAGGFTLSPNNPTIKFNADASLTSASANTNVFTLAPGDPSIDTWTVALSGTNADKFSVEVGNATSVGANLWKGVGTIMVTAKEENYSGKYSATIEITHNATNTKTIAVTQDFFSLLAIPLSSIDIPETGGNRSVRITTSASQTLNWTATLTGKPALALKGFTPFFVGADGKPIMNGENYATTMTGTTPTVVEIGMIGINQDIRAEGAPEATLNVALTDKPTVTATPVVIKQVPVKYYNIYGQSTSTSFATWYGNNAYIAMFKQHLVDYNNFGPNGTVYAQSAPNVEDYSTTVVNNNSGESRKRLFNLNGAAYIPAANASSWTSFRNDPYVVWVLTTHLEQANQVFNNVGFGGYGFKNITAAVPNTYDNTITSEDKTINSEIYKYLIGGAGPFGKVNVSNVKLRSIDAANGLLANDAWPDTFIPLIRYENPGHAQNGGCVVGIDPTLRIIWMGETEIFTTTSANNYTPDALAFMNNLQAWMIMTANYGDSFNERFKIK